MPNAKPKILIIGAGIAGLAVATELQKYGFEVTILEARDRCGGRIAPSGIPEIPFGRGAGWIHGTRGNPIAALAEKTNAKFVATDPARHFMLDRHGNIISSINAHPARKKLEEKFFLAQEYAKNASADMTLSTVLSSFIDPNKLTTEENFFLQIKKLYVENYIGAGCELVSARHWDEEEALPGDNCILIDGYEPIIKMLSVDCTIKLNCIVQEINERAEDVEIITPDEKFYADAVIVTLPLGVLKKKTVKFNPELPIFKKEAIDRLGMGLFNILAMKFPENFLPENYQIMLFDKINPSSIASFFNIGHFLNEPILAAYVGGVTAAKLEECSDEEVIESTMKYLRDAFGKKIPYPEKYFLTRWLQDPFSYGSYSYLPVGATGEDYEALARPISDRIFFAGEATSRHFPATTHGAYLSGIREAERLKQLLK